MQPTADAALLIAIVCIVVILGLTVVLYKAVTSLTLALRDSGRRHSDLERSSHNMMMRAIEKRDNDPRVSMATHANERVHEAALESRMRERMHRDGIVGAVSEESGNGSMDDAQPYNQD